MASGKSLRKILMWYKRNLMPICARPEPVRPIGLLSAHYESVDGRFHPGHSRADEEQMSACDWVGWRQPHAIATWQLLDPELDRAAFTACENR